MYNQSTLTREERNSNMENLVIEDLKYKDIDECFEMNKLIFKEDHGLFDIKKLYKKLHKKRKEYRFLVAKLDKKIVGYISITIAYNLFDGNKPFMTLWWVGTHPDYRRKGIATELFKETEKIAKKRNCELIYFISERDNIVAHKFYKKMGYDEEINK